MTATEDFLATFPAGNVAAFTAFVRFSSAQVASEDIDVASAHLRRLYALEGLPEDTRLWRTLVYLAWHHVGSAVRVWTEFPRASVITAADLTALTAGGPLMAAGWRTRGGQFAGPTGLERAARFLTDAVRHAEAAGGLAAWVKGLVKSGDREADWTAVRGEVERFAYWGPTASFRWSELLLHTHGLPLDAPNIGDKPGRTGPIASMADMTGLSWERCAGDVPCQRALLAATRAAGAALGGLDQLETCLCDFRNLRAGRGYPGMDIDGQMEEMSGLDRAGVEWAARSAFPNRFRGEIMGWSGVRRHLKPVYRDTGRLVNV